MESPVTSEIASWVFDLQGGDIPHNVREKAIEHILDGYSVGLAGVITDGHQIIRRHIADYKAEGQAQVFGLSMRAPAELAALLNGVSMHAMDYDDTQIPRTIEHSPGSLVHPTTPALGAASAVAERIGASGKDLVTAFVIGVEVQCLLADAISRRAGFHPTSIIGGFGAFAAAGKLLGLNRGQLRRGLGIAAVLGAGYGPNNGTMTKWLQAGQAAQAGVFAAYLAKSGFTAAENMFDDPRGFHNTAGEGLDRSRFDGKLGNPYFLVDPGIAIKPYPSGSLGHPGQDAVLKMIEEHDIKPVEVDEAIVGTNSDIPHALRHPRPKLASEARFSFPYNLAIALVRRRAGVHDFTDEVVQSQEVQDMLQRCHHVVDEEIEQRRRHMEARITLKLKDGRVYETIESIALGHPLKPMSREQLAEKFLDCASLVIEKSQAERAVEQIWELESLENVTELHQNLAGSTPA